MNILHENKISSIFGGSMLLKKQIKLKDTTIQTQFYVTKCKYCGKTFIKFENKTMYCTDKCKYYSTLEHTNKRVRKHRRNDTIKHSSKWIGTGHLGHHTSGDWETEKLLIVRERKRLKLKT